MAAWVSVRAVRMCVVIAAVLALLVAYLGTSDPTNVHANTPDECQTTMDELRDAIAKEGVSVTVPTQLPGPYNIQCAYMQNSRFIDATLLYHQSSQFTHVQQKAAVSEFIGSGGIVISILREDIPEDDPTFNNKMLHAESELALFASENREAELRYADNNPVILTSNAQSSAANEVILYLDDNILLDIGGPLSHDELLKISESMLE